MKPWKIQFATAGRTEKMGSVTSETGISSRQATEVGQLELGTEVIDEQYSQRSKVNFDRPYHNLKVTADRLPWHVNIGFKSVIKRYRQFLSVYRHRPLYSGCGSGEK